MARTKFVPNSDGMTNLMKSREMQDDLEERADRVQAAANAELALLDAPYPDTVADTTVGRNRAGATITGVPMPLERSRRILGGAVDAAG